MNSSSNGFLVPASYTWTPTSDKEMNTASLIFGITLGISIFTVSKATQQTISSVKRSQRLTTYIMMIWGNWVSNMGIAPLTWFYLRGVIKNSFWLWFFILVLWCFQVQLLVQIIINRVTLLMAVRSTATNLKWVAFVIIGLINISVFVIWIPANLEISETWIRINNIWDRVEKCIFLVLDASLNCYFVYLVRTRLIANGLTKYTNLFRFNLAMIFFSVCLDAILVGLMSLPNHILYLQFQCLAYIIKLAIEMNMADLIRKVVKASNKLNEIYTGHAPKNHSRGWPLPRGLIATISRGAKDLKEVDINRHGACGETGQSHELAYIPSRRETALPPRCDSKRTVRTDVRVSMRDNESECSSIGSSSIGSSSTESSTHQLRNLPILPSP
ncbi:hypothetical protein F5X96DRAFT_620842 [Biscogniauxia mediterranea]|nr:hypothetical protein F5X96DRAFT_620842 [Biscogniauxia mediterranea]